MVDVLHDLLRPVDLTTVVDIGANPIDGTPPYRPLLERRLCRVIGFEPDPTGLSKLNLEKSDLELYLPHALGDGRSAVLKVCALPGMTSLLTPDANMLMHFPMFPDWARVIKQIPIKTRQLDEIAEIARLDYLKIDVQGSELSIFMHGRKKLRDAVVVQTEVSFLCLYESQPPFGAIDLELRNLGFVPHCFAAINRRMIAPLISSDPNQVLNQLLEADIVYVRDFTRPELMNPEQLKHLAIIAHHCYKSYDLAVNCIHHLVKANLVTSDATQKYMASLRNADVLPV